MGKVIQLPELHQLSLNNRIKGNNVINHQGAKNWPSRNRHEHKKLET